MESRQGLRAIVGTLFTLPLLSEVSFIVLPRLKQSISFADMDLDAVTTGEAAFTLLPLTHGGEFGNR